jgi:prevent-host-death family protein
MKAAEFKARCLEVMEEVAASGEPVIVTKRGRPVAQLAPLSRRPKSLRGYMKGQIRSVGDIAAPTGATWDSVESLAQTAPYRSSSPRCQ